MTPGRGAGLPAAESRGRSSRLPALAAAVLASVLLAGAASAGAQAPTLGAARAPAVLALVNGTLIDGSGAGPVEDAVVLVRGRRVVAAGPGGRVPVPASARRIDVHGGTILPGLINTHVHQAFDEATLRAWLSGGVTTVRDLGAGTSFQEFAERDLLNRSSRTARLLSVGAVITVPGGYPQAIWGAPALEVRSPAQARAQTERLIAAGADSIKIALESGTSFHRGALPMLSDAEVKAIVAVAHAHGKRVSAHPMVTADIERALAGGVDEIAHYDLERLPQALIRRMVARGVDWVPTLELFHLVPVATPCDNLRRFVRAGGIVALGTDYLGLGPGYDYDLGTPSHELASMRRCGLTAMQVIVAATRNAAYAVGRADLGLLRPGKTADIVVVRGNPLASLEAMRRVVLVVHDGTVALDRTR